MRRYRVLRAVELRGTLYREGGVALLTDKRAAQLSRVGIIERKPLPMDKPETKGGAVACIGTHTALTK